ncbi:hypothetical protein CIB48_g9762 [Xylaria polymorpha]|nr:hypothetical protein CIB48_g9762 [Xylaria polymorpha]
MVLHNLHIAGGSYVKVTLINGCSRVDELTGPIAYRRDQVMSEEPRTAVREVGINNPADFKSVTSAGH